MIKVNEIIKRKTVKFPSEGLKRGYEDYANKAFEYLKVVKNSENLYERLIESDSQSTTYEAFIDWYRPNWIQGNNLNVRLIEELIDDRSQLEFNEEWDVDLMGRRFTKSIRHYVEQKILQKLHIHRAELHYPFENTENLGIPYLDKPTQDVLDLFIKEAIQEVIGVKEILEFKSRLANDEVRGKKYFLNLVVQAEDEEVVTFDIVL